MSASKAAVVVLHCDQGMGTLVKVYEKVMDEEQLTHLAVIDLGSETRTKRYATDAVDEVMNALKEMSTPCIDLLVLSHQDTDHWSLLPNLLERIKAESLTVTVKEFYRGGARWKQGALKAVKSYEQYFDVESEPLPRAHSDYADPAGAPGELADLAGVAFRVLAVNTPISRSAEDLIRNGTSAVIVVDFGGNRTILPGDATADTIAFINTILDDWDKAGKSNPVIPCFLLGAPHHGALRTIANNFTTKMPRLDIATTFANAVKAEWVAASAGYESQFYHPFKRVMAILGVNAGSKAIAHTYVVWDDEVATWEGVVDTDKNLFTTICSLTDPPVRQSWIFTMEASGALKISVVKRGGPPEVDAHLQARAR